MPAHPHLDALHRALAAAGAHERDALERLAELPLSDRILHGTSWPRLAVEDARWAGRGKVRLTVRAPSGGDLHEGLGPGDRVEVDPGGTPLPGRIDDAGSRWAEVLVHGDIDIGERVVITRRFDPTPWRRMADALARADGHRSALRDVLLGERPPSEPSSHGPRLDDPTLNPAQLRAGEIALDAGEVALVHGPPGTGKTTLLVALLRQLVKHDRPWALADSNAAVDHLVVRSVAAGLDVVRVGAWGRMSRPARAHALRTRVAEGPYGKALEAMDRDLSRLAHREDRDDRRAWGRLMGERRELKERAERAALESAQIIATTLGTLLWRAPHLPTARHAVVDEATQALEPSVWAAVPYVERLILVGDPNQLGPVVRAPDSPLQASLLDRLLDPEDAAGGVLPLPMLDVQHRMHRDIQALVQPVYGDTYRPHPDVQTHLLRDLPGVQDTPLTGRPTLWIDTAGADAAEHLDETTRSYANPTEAQLVAAVVARLLAAGVHPDQMGIIAPYSAQVRALRDLLGPRFRVASVDAFQGQEREVVLISWTRSNPDGNLGFVTDRRRATVALTRARRLVVCIGDSGTLAWDSTFAEVLETLEGQGAVQSVWEEPWSEVVE